MPLSAEVKEAIKQVRMGAEGCTHAQFQETYGKETIDPVELCEYLLALEALEEIQDVPLDHVDPKALLAYSQSLQGVAQKLSRNDPKRAAEYQLLQLTYLKDTAYLAGVLTETDQTEKVHYQLGMFALNGIFHVDRSDGAPETMWLLERNPKRGFDLLTLASGVEVSEEELVFSEKGYGPAQYQLGKIYEKKGGLKESGGRPICKGNLNTYVGLVTEAAKSFPPAARELGWYSLKGYTVEEDGQEKIVISGDANPNPQENRGICYLIRASDLGGPVAAFEVGDMLWKGVVLEVKVANDQGVVVKEKVTIAANKPKAIFYYVRAAELGHQGASTFLSRLQPIYIAQALATFYAQQQATEESFRKENAELREELQGTKEELAGQKGRVAALEEQVDLLEQKPPPSPTEPMPRNFILDEDLQLSPHEAHSGEIDFQYCTECLIHGNALNVGQIKEALNMWGDSLVVVGGNNKVKIHIHTNDPERLFQAAREYGEILATKADDMWAQYRAFIDWYANKDIAIVTDSSCCLPQEFIAKYNVIMIPIQVIINDKSFLDRINITPERFYKELRNTKNTVTTSQPTPIDYRYAFEKAQRQAKSAIGIFISGALSGTYDSARSAAKQFAHFPIDVIDSKNTAGGLGLIVEFMSEAIYAGKSKEEVKRITEIAIKNTRMFIAPGTLKNLIKGGRINKTAGRIASLFKLLPILGFGNSDKVSKLGVGFGKSHNRLKTVNLVKKYARSLTKARIIVLHTDIEKVAIRCAKALEKDLGLKNIPVLIVPPVLAAHVGPSAIAIAVSGFAEHEALLLK